MKEALAKFSASFSRLSSMERWFVIIVIIGVFAIVNFVFILPRFNDWSALRNRMAEAQSTKTKYESMIEQAPTFRSQIAKLESENSAVPAEDQAINFLNAIQNQAAQSRVPILANTRQPERTNQFFLERAQSLTTQSGEAELVDFLYNLGAGNSQIRARALSIGRDPSQQQLKATMTLIASFQKKTPARATPKPAPAAATPPKNTNAPVAVRTNAPTAKPGVPPAATGAKPSTPEKK